MIVLPCWLVCEMKRLRAGLLSCYFGAIAAFSVRATIRSTDRGRAEVNISAFRPLPHVKPALLRFPVAALPVIVNRSFDAPEAAIICSATSLVAAYRQFSRIHSTAGTLPSNGLSSRHLQLSTQMPRKVGIGRGCEM